MTSNRILITGLLALLLTTLVPLASAAPGNPGHGKGHHQALPPGLKKNQLRGKPLPPGWHKKLARGQVVSDDLLSHATHPSKQETNRIRIKRDELLIKIDGKLLLINRETKRLLAIL